MKIYLTESQFNHLKDTYRMGFDGANGYVHIDENIEDEVEANEINLDSFEPKQKLADKLWQNNKLDARARLQLLDIADDFIDFLNIDWADYKDIRLTGSICNFNWSNKSDIDVHILYDFTEIDENVELVKQYVDAKKNEWNEFHQSLSIYGFSVELYVEDIHEAAISKGVYSLEKNEWVKIPNKKDIQLKSTNNIKELSADIMTIIDDINTCYDAYKTDADLENLLDEIEDVLSFIKEMRKSQLDENGEMSVGNIVYKVLRREGYIDKLYDLENVIYDKLNSLN